MNSASFPPIARWLLPEDAFRRSLIEMSRDGADGNEGIGLWLGQRRDGSAEITHLALLRGPGVVKRPAFIRLDAGLLNDLTDVTIELGVALVGQIHTHGPGWPLDLSPTDRTYGPAVPWYLSVVAPDYAARPDINFEECAVHVFEPGSGYRRLSVGETSERVQLVPDRHVKIVTVGEPV